MWRSEKLLGHLHTYRGPNKKQKKHHERKKKEICLHVICSFPGSSERTYEKFKSKITEKLSSYGYQVSEEKFIDPLNNNAYFPKDYKKSNVNAIWFADCTSYEVFPPRMLPKDISKWKIDDSVNVVFFTEVDARGLHFKSVNHLINNWAIDKENKKELIQLKKDIDGKMSFDGSGYVRK